ncbi:MAG: DNA repair protein RecN [Oligoflexia bacterium]
MLETLKIKNLAVIDQAEVEFTAGLNILSGETGAGKSIVIEAISLLLGSRASTDLVRTGCDEAVVEGVFNLERLPEIRSRLTELGLCEQGTEPPAELLIKRTVNRGGKHRILINGELATLSNLQRLCDGLVDLCSQHEHQSLLKPSTQLDLLDRYGALLRQRQAVTAAYQALKDLRNESEKLSQDESARLKRLDFVRFQIEELREAQLSPGEDEKLQQEKTLLQSAHQRLQSIDQVRSLLEEATSDSEGAGALQLLQMALQKLQPLVQLDEGARPLVEGLERALAEIEEVALSLNRYSKAVDIDPGRLEVVQERLSTLADLRRKYGESIESMISQLAELEKEHDLLSNSRGRLQELSVEIEKLSIGFKKLCIELSQARARVSGRLSDAVTRELKELNMGDACFEIELTRLGGEFENSSVTGSDSIQFVVQTNRGETARALGKIASGGELSRLMLAIRRVIADRGGIGVYLFDEIDAGMGGQTAFQVGRKLKSVAAHNQVICITHLPQVASFADHHLVVRKAAQGKRTVTEIASLGDPDQIGKAASKSQAAKLRQEELARMLGGPVLTKKSLENAAELMEMARQKT